MNAPVTDINEQPMAPGAVIWTAGIPTLHGSGTTLRELRAADARSVLQWVRHPAVAEFTGPAPETEQDVARFIAWTHRRRALGRHVSFGIVPDDTTGAVGVIQISSIDGNWATAEWGFALDPAYWGSGLFPVSARLAVDFVTNVLAVRRLDALVAAGCVRAEGALRKLGAVCETPLREVAQAGHEGGYSIWLMALDPRPGAALPRRERGRSAHHRRQPSWVAEEGGL